MSRTLINLRRNGQQKGYAVGLDYWHHLDSHTRRLFSDVRTYDGQLKFCDDNNKTVDFRIAVTEYAHKNIWVCLPGEAWKQAFKPIPYQCSRCDCRVKNHICPLQHPPTPLDFLGRLFASKKS